MGGSKCSLESGGQPCLEDRGQNFLWVHLTCSIRENTGYELSKNSPTGIPLPCCSSVQSLILCLFHFLQGGLLLPFAFEKRIPAHRQALWFSGPQWKPSRSSSLYFCIILFCTALGLGVTGGLARAMIAPDDIKASLEILRGGNISVDQLGEELLLLLFESWE